MEKMPSLTTMFFKKSVCFLLYVRSMKGVIKKHFRNAPATV